MYNVYCDNCGDMVACGVPNANRELTGDELAIKGKIVELRTGLSEGQGPLAKRMVRFRISPWEVVMYDGGGESHAGTELKPENVVLCTRCLVEKARESLGEVFQGSAESVVERLTGS